MAESFYTILTNVGKAKIANATALGTKVNFTTLKVGDSNGTYYNPTEAQEDLVHTVWQGNINSITTDLDNPNWIFIIVPIPSNVGGFTIREVGIFDDEGYMLAVGKYPETYKPQAADGSTKEITIRTILEVSNSASVTLKIDPTVTFATQEDIQELRNQIQNISFPVTKVNEKTGNVVLKASDIKTDDGTTLEEVNSNFKSHEADNETEFSNLNARINNLNTNDIQVRNEIMDVKLKLKEQTAIDFVNKTGVGFYDTFADNSNIAPETTASYDSENKRVNFPSVEPYTVKATSDYNGVALINVDKVVGVGDKIDNTNVITNVSSVNNSVTYDRATPVSVVNSGYTTSATARPQVLSNGWIVTCEFDSTGGNLYFKVSKDNGASFQALCSVLSISTTTYFAMCSYGTNIYVIFTNSTNVFKVIFDVTTVTNASQNINSIDSQTSIGAGCSIAVSSTGTLTAAWCSKNSNYSNTNNIRSAKSIDGGITWTKQDGTSGVDQVTVRGATTLGYVNPYVQYDKNNSPIIFSSYDCSAYKILAQIYNGSSWSEKTAYTAESTSYTQAHPTATLQKYGTNAGRIWVVWHGLDNTDTSVFNIYLSYSDDNGISWSSKQKLTSGNSYEQAYPSITSDINGYVYILWHGVNSAVSTSYKQIKQIIWNGSSWSSLISVTSVTTNQCLYPSTCDNYNNFTNPITIWQDSQNTRVAFYGKWTIGTITYDITLTDPVTVSENEELLIYPIEKMLKMKDEAFDTFNDLDLSLYVDKINKATIKGAVDNSTTVITGATDKTLTAGDKLLMDGVLNEVLNATGNFITNTVTDATVVNQAYDTSGNGGRKLVRLSNGWLVASCLCSTSQIKFYIDKRDGNGFIPSCTIYAGAAISSWAIQSKGNIIYGIHCTTSSKGSVCTFNFDATTIGTTTIDTSLTAYSIDSTQTDTEGGCSLVVDSTGNYLHAAWSSKNSTYPNSFNIRYCKGTINSDGSVTWGSVRQVTSINASDYNITTPTIILRQDNNPGIISSYVSSSANYIRFDYYDGTEWHTGEIQIYSGGAYAQSNPCAIFVPQSINGLANGRIWVSWVSGDSSDNNAIGVSYSDDNGATWSSRTKLSGSIFYAPTIAFNTDNEGFILCYNNDSNIYRTTWDASTGWSGVVSIISGGGKQYPSAIGEIFNFTIPLFIYKDGQTGQIGVKFRGRWTVGEGYTLTMQTPTTLTDGQQVPIADFEVKQEDVDLELDNIDTEKFIFKGSNLNTDNASIKILGKDNKLNAIAYAIA
ncbi:phage tail protein [Clostridium kluyveri]|uniref:Predicted phage tail fibre protein n=1 Tax=Clostridium kluyveri (strain ATCC 8527 / DSM 555 / NBRC 12016 / NCIMB 10680 / K1) TaxID=431943 RepID=A5MYJ9_CLOK5|nr:phage tail protein [Clostridium kluyveri]EDK33945.1 Predicted phage tail fibre protein [Clostridium kluyveri DSM 555]